MSTYTRNDRELNKIRSLEIIPNFQPNNQSSCLVKLGNTHVCCSAILEDRVPGFLRNSGKGWLTAEYGMLPSSTSERMDREAAKGPPCIASTIMAPSNINSTSDALLDDSMTFPV